MTKRNQRGRNSNAVIPKSMLPKRAKRITNAQGERVWVFNSMEFWSKRDLLTNRPKAILRTTAFEGTIEGTSTMQERILPNGNILIEEDDIVKIIDPSTE